MGRPHQGQRRQGGVGSRPARATAPTWGRSRLAKRFWRPPWLL
jgi:hypothetical protein